MPELPEVHNTVEGLRQNTVGATIEDMWTSYNSIKYSGKQNIKDPAYFACFKQQVRGATIVGVTRRAKHIFIELDSGARIAVHMKMTGHFLVGNWEWNKRENKWQPEPGFWDCDWKISLLEVRNTMPLSDPYNDHIRLMFMLTDGRQIAFSDMRKFATIKLLPSVCEQEEIEKGYGLEPLARATSKEDFVAAISQRAQTPIKTALLDQSLVAGFGNIYSDEALYKASIHPNSQVKAIPRTALELLYSQGKALLQTAITHGGDSTGDYRRVDGSGGSFHGLHQIYQREGLACKRCGELIEKQKIGQRVSRYCPHCQILY